MPEAMLVAKAMCIVMELGAIRVAAGIWQICANIQKLCSFQPGLREIIC